MSEASAERHRSRHEGRAGARVLATGACLLMIMALNACSSAFLFDDEELEPQRIETTKSTAEDESYPNLSSVPDEPPLPSASAARQNATAGLAADRENARYTDEALTAREEPAGVAEAASTPMPPPPSPAAAVPLSGSAPPPPDLGGGAAPPPPSPARQDESLLSQALPPDSPSPPAPAAPAAAPAAPSPPAMPAAQQTPPGGLLQQQAFQQQAMSMQRQQQMAMQQQAFDQEARRQAIEQQMLRDQMIQQQQWQRQAMQVQARQLAGNPPLPVPAMAPGAPPQLAAAYPMAPQGGVSSVSPGMPVSGQLIAVIYFGHGSAGLDEKDRRVLRGVVDLQRQSGGRPMAVVGHSSARTRVIDPVKHQEINLGVSMQRANRVVETLVRLGVDRGQMQVVARSDSQPVYHEFMPTGEAGNRRVEIFLQ